MSPPRTRSHQAEPSLDHDHAPTPPLLASLGLSARAGHHTGSPELPSTRVPLRTSPSQEWNSNGHPLSGPGRPAAAGREAKEQDHPEATKSLRFIYLMIAVYAASYHMSFPIYPFLVAKFRDGTMVENQLAFGAFRSFNQTLQLIGSLVAGSLVDRIGCKNVILLSFVASVFCYILLALAKDLPTLYLSQFPALFQHVLLGSRGYVSFAVTGDKRSVAFGRLGTSYGLGAVIGPALGGILGKTSFSLPAVVSASACLLAGLAVYHGLPDIHYSATAQKVAELKFRMMPPPSPLTAYLDLLRNSRVASILLLKTFFLISVSLFGAATQMTAGPVFGMDTATSGWLMSYSSTLGIIAQSLLVGPVLKVLSPQSTTLGATIVLVPCYLLLGSLSLPWHLYAITTPLTPVHMLHAMISAQEAVDAAPASGRGSYIGLEQALGSGARMLAPAAAGYVLARSGLGGIGLVCAGMVFLGLLAQRITGRGRRRHEGTIGKVAVS